MYIIYDKNNKSITMISDLDSSRKTNKPNVGVVLVAAGESTRMGSIDKIFSKIGNKEVISYSLSVFNSSPIIGSIVLVLNKETIKLGQKLVMDYGFDKVSKIITGGARRQDSVLLGLKEINDFDIVMIHDGARPFINLNMLKLGKAAVNKTGAAIPVIPLEDSLKYVNSNGFVIDNVDRKNLYLVQTPQVFNHDIIFEAHYNIKKNVTDDSSMVELNNGKISVFEGLKDNFKLTTISDYSLAESIISYKIKSGKL